MYSPMVFPLSKMFFFCISLSTDSSPASETSACYLIASWDLADPQRAGRPITNDNSVPPQRKTGLVYLIGTHLNEADILVSLGTYQFYFIKMIFLLLNQQFEAIGIIHKVLSPNVIPDSLRSLTIMNLLVRFCSHLL